MMAKYRLASNLSFMFGDCGNLLQRYSAAKQAGFSAVECAFPYEFPVEEVVKAKEEAGVDQVLINAHPGEPLATSKGLAALPGREEDFKKSLETSIVYAKALKCPKIHIMAGSQMQGIIDCGMMEVYEENMVTAAEMLEDAQLVGLIEPISPRAVPNYFMSSFEEAVRIIKKINSPNLMLQVDIFHLQSLRGNITCQLKEWMPLIGHIQIAQVPDRNEPDTPGEINYPYVFDALTSLGYDGAIGLEYKPKGSTVDGLKWIKNYGLSL